MEQKRQKMLYLFSGLGADRRIFTHLEMKENHKFIDWSIPLSHESLAEYVDRLIFEQMDTQFDISIIGVSFGGIVGIEVAKRLGVKKIMIISSVKTYLEIPSGYRFLGILGIDKFMPAQILKWSNPVLHYFFGVSSVSDKTLLKMILLDTNEVFLKWAIRQILMWRNETIIETMIHIHGTNDKILGYKYVKNAIPIKGGGHLMVLNKYGEIRSIIETFLAE